MMSHAAFANALAYNTVATATSTPDDYSLTLRPRNRQRHIYTVAFRVGDPTHEFTNSANKNIRLHCTLFATRPMFKDEFDTIVLPVFRNGLAMFQNKKADATFAKWGNNSILVGNDFGDCWIHLRQYMEANLRQYIMPFDARRDIPHIDIAGSRVNFDKVYNKAFALNHIWIISEGVYRKINL